MIIIFILALELLGLSGSVFTRKNIPTWYRGLNKPSFNPPNWVFGPVWTLLYGLQGAAAYLIFKQTLFHPIAKTAFVLFILQLVLNLFWTPLFFALHKLFLALIEILVFWAVLLVVTILFFQVKPLAGWLMLPYLCWVSFASLLNYFIWKLNKKSA